MTHTLTCDEGHAQDRTKWQNSTQRHLIVILMRESARTPFPALIRRSNIVPAHFIPPLSSSGRVTLSGPGRLGFQGGTERMLSAIKPFSVVGHTAHRT